MSCGVLTLSTRRGLSKSCSDSKPVLQYIGSYWQHACSFARFRTDGNGVVLIGDGIDRLSTIRMKLGRALKARNVPRLEFRLNELSAAQAAVEREFDRLAKAKGE